MSNILTPEFLKKCQIPATPIQTTPLQVSDPEWGMSNDFWWKSSNIGDYKHFAEDMKYTNNSRECWEDFVKLHQILLRIGGEQTCFPAIEEDMKKILDRGRFYPGRSKMMVGEPSQCHRNSCELWRNNHKDLDITIATGYALSADGIWRQHSWLVHRYQTATQHRTRIIETTVKRLAYFGFEMTEDEAYEFDYNNN